MSDPYVPPQSLIAATPDVTPRWRRILVSCGLSIAGTLLIALAVFNGLPNNPWSFSFLVPVWLVCTTWVISNRADPKLPRFQRVLLSVVAFVAMAISSIFALFLSVFVLPD